MVTTEIPERRCDWCYPANLYRVDRRPYEWALAVLDLHPYVCCICGARGLMIGRSYAYNWRRRRIRIRIVFRVNPGFACGLPTAFRLIQHDQLPTSSKTSS
jgi:hypothetical protein